MTTQPPSSPSEETPTNQSGGIDLTSQNADVHGDVTGRDKLVSIGTVIYMQNPSAESVTSLLRVGALSTEVTRPTNPAASVQSSPSASIGAVDASALKSLDETLKLFQQQGATANELWAGEVSVSRVDVLLKKAILLQAEADDLHTEAMQPARGATPRAVDETAIHAKLKQAYDLLQEANQFDPTDTEVLLHIAQVLTQLTPDDPSDEQKILRRIQKLLGNPKTDTERFQLAQAKLPAGNFKSAHSTRIGSQRSRDVRTVRPGRLGTTLRWVVECPGMATAG